MDTQYSGLVQQIEGMFRFHKNLDDVRYLAIIWDFYGDCLHSIKIKRGESPAAAYASFLSKLKPSDASAFVLGFDLDIDFEDQFPEHYGQIQTMEAFTLRPLSYIPEADGHTLAEHYEAAQQRALYPKPRIISRTQDSELQPLSPRRYDDLWVNYAGPEAV